MDPTTRPSILVADDQPDVLEALRLLLKGEGYDAVLASSPGEVLEVVGGDELGAVLMDLNYARDTTSGQEGLDLLSRLRELDPHLPVVVMTAWASVDVAVEAMRRGASDFVEKPWENARLLSILRTQLELARALREGRRLEAENELLRRSARADSQSFIATAPSMQPVLDVIARVGPSDANILITGENGTGKGVVARRLHAVSRRADRPIVSVNVGGLSEGIFESELFGHVRGAFTDAKSDRVGRFELADGGTLFLDEIANVSPNLQAKLLRVLETGELERVGSSRTRRVDVRVYSATNADIRAEVEAGRFRQDLLYRLNTVEVELPPLRQRREDIPLLADHFLRQHRRRYRKEIDGFTAGARQVLLDYGWPGNVRELDHVVERSVLMAEGRSIRPGELGLRGGGGASPRLEDMSLDEVERHLIERTLARHDGNVTRAASALGLSRSALYRRIDKHGL
jgi:DNA-binding NtrC family response regulator